MSDSRAFPQTAAWSQKDRKSWRGWFGGAPRGVLRMTVGAEGVADSVLTCHESPSPAGSSCRELKERTLELNWWKDSYLGISGAPSIGFPLDYFLALKFEPLLSCLHQSVCLLSPVCYLKLLFHFALLSSHIFLSKYILSINFVSASELGA